MELGENWITSFLVIIDCTQDWAFLQSYVTSYQLISLLWLFSVSLMSLNIFINRVSEGFSQSLNILRSRDWNFVLLWVFDLITPGSDHYKVRPVNFHHFVKFLQFFVHSLVINLYCKNFIFWSILSTVLPNLSLSLGDDMLLTTPTISLKFALSDKLATIISCLLKSFNLMASVPIFLKLVFRAGHRRPLSK